MKVLSGPLKSQTKADQLKQSDAVVTTVQSLRLSIENGVRLSADLFDLIIWDEAHHAPAPSWRDLAADFPLARQALFTATPFRRDSKNIKGRIVFEYPLSRAREDGVYGRLTFEPVDPGRIDADLALARATQRRFDLDAKAGFRHLVMVRASTRTRAEALAELYAAKTRLRLRTVFGNHSRNRLLDAVDALRRRDLDGIVCVDMLGEGFDLPALKIAAPHSPHKSLAVTLQFIGRFARTTGSDTGDATFLAVPAEIEAEAKELYKVGAEWNEIVEEASRARIDAETVEREVLAAFAPVEIGDARPGFAERPIDPASLWPFFHVKVLQVPGGVDLHRSLAVPFPEDVVLLERSSEIPALVCITRHIAACRWSDDERISDVRHDLFVIYYEQSSQLLFVCLDGVRRR